MTGLSDEHIPRQCPGLDVEVVGEEILVLDEATGVIHKLNVTAALIFQLSDGVNSVSAIKRNVSESFETSPEQVDADVDGFLLQLKDLDLVTFE